MEDLRLALIGLGLLFLAGLVVWEWRRSRRQFARSEQSETTLQQEPVERLRRIEPSIDGKVPFMGPRSDEALDFPAIHPVEPMRLGVASQSAVDVPAAARFAEAVLPVAPAAPVAPVAPAVATSAVNEVAVQWPPAHAERVLSLRIVSPRGEALSGRQLRRELAIAGLVHGPQMIYHRVDDQGRVLVSAANLVRPGNLDPATMDVQEFRGLSLFSVLPGPLPAVRMLEELVALARNLAYRLGATVQDEHGADLDGVLLTQLRKSLPQDVDPSEVGETGQ